MNRKLVFNKFDKVLLAVIIVELILYLVNSSNMNMWKYYIWSGIVPMALMIIFNSVLLSKMEFSRQTISMIIVTFIEALILLICTQMTDLDSIISNTLQVGSLSSMKMCVYKSAFENLSLTFIPLFFLSEVGVAIVHFLEKNDD